jgi:hypothetical protein
VSLEMRFLRILLWALWAMLGLQIALSQWVYDHAPGYLFISAAALGGALMLTRERN